MNRFRMALSLFVALAALGWSQTPLHAQALDDHYARDPQQPIDQHYSDQIRKYTTDPQFLSPLVSYLPRT